VAGDQSRTGSDHVLMQRAAHLLATDISLGELFERLTKMLPEYLDSSVVFVALRRPGAGATIEYFYDHGDVRSFPHIQLSDGSRALDVIRSGQIIWGNDPSVWAPQGSQPINKDRPWTNDTVSAIFVPMNVAGQTVGCLSVQSVRPSAYTFAEVEVVAAIGHYIGIAVENQRMYQALAHTAEFDQLTGLRNYSSLSRELDDALTRATPQRPATAFVLDIVNFAAFNDLYGYLEGDDVLRRVAAVLREFEDEGVVAGRFGGDVFVLVVKESPIDEVASFVERLGARLRELAYVANDQTIPISVACGYALAPLDGDARHDVVALCVDRARISRMKACRPTRTDALDAFALHGTFAGIETIVAALIDRDPYTRVHVLDVHAMAKSWSEFNLELDPGSLVMLLQASLLHDAGKLLVSDRILVKPGNLNAEDYAAVKSHATYGRNILALHEGYEEVADIVGQHHERWDGRGYPNGLRGEEIHPLARAIAVIDVYSAMVADRPYHRGIPPEAALVELQRCSGTQFDPEYVARFVEWHESERESA
jgi:diguanylate cyclase (GGDEF)-like protein